MILIGVFSIFLPSVDAQTNMYSRDDSNSPNSCSATFKKISSGALDLSSASRKPAHQAEDLRKTPSPSHGSIYSEGSPSISIGSSPGKCSDMQIGRFNLSGLNLLPRNLLTPTVSADDRMSPRSLASHIKREMGEPNHLVNLHMEQQIPIHPTAALINTSMNVAMGNGTSAPKAARPFKAYPHDPLSLAASFTATDGLLDSQSAEKYNEFRKRMIEQIYAANGGQATVSNPKMRRTNGSSLPPFEHMEVLSTTSSSADSTNSTPTKHVIMPSPSPNLDTTSDSQCDGGKRDSAYYERRRKNNAAAKKSRDRRRIKEDEIAIRAAFLERENIELKFELATARKQLALYGIGRG